MTNASDGRAGDFLSDDAARKLIARLRSEPQRFARYERRDLIGRGGMGSVFDAADRDIGRRVAMKVLDTARNDRRGLDDEDRVRRFLAEVQVMGQLDHPGIVPVHDLGLDSDGRVYFTMKLVRGRTFTQVLEFAEQGTEGWTETRVLGVLVRVCEALAFAHDRGVIHRDLKPDNVMVGRFGETYVMDWGLARILDGAIGVPGTGGGAPSSVLHTVRDTPDGIESPLATVEGALIGTPSFMAPEQAEGRVHDLSPRTDVHAVGAILYQVLSGRVPYSEAVGEHSPRATIERVKAGPPTPIRELAPNAAADLVAICEKAMARRPADRYATAMDLAADIEAYLDRRPVAARSPGVLHAVRLGIERNRAVALTTLVATLVLAVFGAWSLLRVSESQRSSRQVMDCMASQVLVDEVATLTPRDPLRTSDSRRWLRRVEAFLARAEVPPGADDTATGLTIAEREKMAQRLATLAALVPQVSSDLSLADECRRAPQGLALERWQSVFHDLESDPRFAELDHVAQPGLLPLGKNPAGFWQFLVIGTGTEPAMDAQGIPQIVSETGIVLVLLPGGVAQVGRDESSKLEPKREVKLRPFLMGCHEITQAQWRRAMQQNPAKCQRGVQNEGSPFDDRHPVENISWYEATRFAALSAGRLPSEYELEYVARANHPSAWLFDGLTPEQMQDIENLAGGEAGSSNRDHYKYHAPVGSFPPNSYGLFDVAGNVSEWAVDFQVDELAASDASRATMPDQLRRRMIRGSNWGEPFRDVRASFRKHALPGYATHWVGMRLARSWTSRAALGEASNLSPTSTGR